MSATTDASTISKDNATSRGLAAMLPGLRIVADALSEEAIADADAAGEPVQCFEGCGACCRQLVPVLPPEADAIRALVRALPPSRRETVRRRAMVNRSRADATGLGEALDEGGGATIRSRHALSNAWFALRLDCPFLEGGACSIYAERPLACREYLVTSDPRHCTAPTSAVVRRVVLRGSAQEAWKRAATAAGEPEPRRTTFLVDAILS